MFVRIVLLALFSWHRIGAQQFIQIDDEIGYKDPVFPLRGFDFKIASLKPNYDESNRKFNQASLTSAAALCQVNFVNQGMANVTLDGKLSISFQEYQEFAQTSQNAYMSMLKGNLINATTKQPLNPDFDKTALFIGSDGQGNARVDSAISGAYSLPYLSAASLAQSGPINNIIYNNVILNQTFFELRLASNNSILNALVPFLTGMNWTLVGALYETTIFGYISEQITQLFQNNNKTPYFACKTYIATVDSASGWRDPSTAKAFCECLKISFNEVNVVVMFSALDNALNIAKVVEEACGNPGYTYIVTADDYLTPLTRVEQSQNPLNNGFLIRTFYNWDIIDYFKSCYDTLDKTSLPFVAQELQVYFSENFQCVFSFDNPDNLEVCPDNVEDRTYDCLCPETSGSTDQTVLVSAKKYN